MQGWNELVAISMAGRANTVIVLHKPRAKSLAGTFDQRRLTKGLVFNCCWQWGKQSKINVGGLEISGPIEVRNRVPKGSKRAFTRWW